MSAEDELVETLLNSKRGARSTSHIDDLLKIASKGVEEQDDQDRDDDPQLRLKIVKILKATLKDVVLTHFIDRRGLDLIHRWIKKALVSGSESSSSSTENGDADFVVETLKLLRQLPVNGEQLKQNTELCRFLRSLSKSKSSHGSLVIELAKDVVELWRREVQSPVDGKSKHEQEKVKKKAVVVLPREDRSSLDVSPKEKSRSTEEDSLLLSKNPSGSVSDTALVSTKKIEGIVCSLELWQ